MYVRVALFVLFVWLPLAAACQEERGGDSATTGTLAQGEVLLVALPEEQQSPPVFDADDRKEERDRLVRRSIQGDGIAAPETLAAMRRVPRHLFVPRNLRDEAYKNHPLPIGHGQTISQPYIVGFMTELLNIDSSDTVLEIGTGSAYQAAILAETADEVVTIEIVEPLARQAADRLENLGYTNVTAVWGDGYFGWPAGEPYDAIIVTAAAEHVPPPLIDQLKPGGRMVIPVGRSGWSQNLLLIEKDAEGKITTKNVLPVRFVPLTREKR